MSGLHYNAICPANVTISWYKDKSVVIGLHCRKQYFALYPTSDIEAKPHTLNIAVLNSFGFEYNKYVFESFFIKYDCKIRVKRNVGKHKLFQIFPKCERERFG